MNLPISLSRYRKKVKIDNVNFPISLSRYRKKVKIDNVNLPISLSRYRKNDIAIPCRPRGTLAPPKAELQGKLYTDIPLNPEWLFALEDKRKAVFFGAVPRARPNPDEGGGREVRGTRATKKKHVRGTRFFQTGEGFIEGERNVRYFLRLTFFASIGDFS